MALIICGLIPSVQVSVLLIYTEYDTYIFYIIIFHVFFVLFVSVALHKYTNEGKWEPGSVFLAKWLWPRTVVQSPVLEV